MNTSDLTPFFAINLLCFAVAWFIARTSRFYVDQLEHIADGRASMIDGLRGWLALSVFFAHAIAMQSYFAEGNWHSAFAGVYGMAGEVGVSLFFMITGFLFWGRIRRSGGKLNVPALYVSRVRRIVPMYFVSVAMALVVVVFISGFTLQVEFQNLIRELRSWFSFGYLYAGNINGVKDAHYINAVYWTLAFEWSFYIALPFFALFSRGARAFALFLVAFFYCLQAPITLNFICGALAAVLVEKNLIDARLSIPVLTLLPLAALAAVFLFPSAFSLPAIGLLFIFFLFVVGGNSLFGLLATRTSRLLGTVSYSIYLTHCIVLYSIVRIADVYLPIKAMGPSQYWLLVSIAALVTVLISTVSYRYVEFVFSTPGAIVKDIDRKSFDGILESPR